MQETTLDKIVDSIVKAYNKYKGNKVIIISCENIEYFHTGGEGLEYIIDNEPLTQNELNIENVMEQDEEYINRLRTRTLNTNRLKSFIENNFNQIEHIIVKIIGRTSQNILNLKIEQIINEIPNQAEEYDQDNGVVILKKRLTNGNSFYYDAKYNYLKILWSE